MSKGFKIALVVCAAALVCGIASCVFLLRTVSQAFVADPAEAAHVGRQIVQYTPPDGYSEQMAMSMFGMKMVAIGPTTPNAGAVELILMQPPSGVRIDPERAQEQLERALARRGSAARDLRPVGSQEVVVRGASVTMTVSEGGAGQDGRTRQVFGVFPNAQGDSVVFMALGASDAWDQRVVDDFLTSIE